MFKSQREECKEQCLSCPFRFGNNTEFGEILHRLKKKFGGPLMPRPTAKEITSARIMVMKDTEVRGDFSCHLTVYDKDMTEKPPAQWRQCPGATKWHRAS